MDLPTFSDLVRIGRAEALHRNRQLTAEEIDRRGSDLNNLIAAPAAMADEVMAQLALAKKDLYLGTAEDSALDRLILDRYPDLPRKQASPSYGYATFRVLTAAVAAFTIPDGTLLSAGPVQFITVGDTVLALGASSVRASVRSVFAGANQKAILGAINTISSILAGQPAGLTVSNDAATFGGEDRETDADYATRARRYFLASRRATIGAIETAILSVPGVVTATVFEHLDTLGRPIGYVQAVVADTYTDQFIVPGPPAAYASQAASLTNQIQSVLREWRSAGVGVRVVIASVVLQSIRLSLAYAAGADEEAIKQIVLTSVIQYVNNLPPGALLSVATLRDIIRGISGVVYTGGEVLSPTGNIVPMPGQVLRTSSTFTTVV